MICRSWSYKGPSRKECTNISLSIRNWWSPDCGNNVHIFQWPKDEQKYGHYCLKKSSFLTHIIVSQGDWLWKPANIKGENNGSVVYFQSFLTVHNPMAQWWEHSPSTNVALVQFPALKSCVGWVCCWFSPFLRKAFLWVIRFSPLLNNQPFQIQN